MSTLTRLGRRLAVITAAVAMGVIGFIAPAHADSSNIDPARKATLTVHKCVQGNTPGQPASGADQGNACTPLNGVTFTLYKVDGIDLTTNDGWTAIQGLTAPETGTTVGGHTSTQVSAQVTAGQGVASWNNLDLGLYLVVETDLGNPQTGVVLASKPFLVTLPYNTNNAWNYDVHVYPKNSVAQITKQVTDDVTQAGYKGQGVKWTITADVPPGGEGQPITAYSLQDTIPAGLTHVSTTLALSGGGTLDPADYTCTTVVVCTFTTSGIAKLQAAGGQQVVMTIITDVTDVAQANQGVFTNTASVTINGVTQTATEATTTWGQLTVSKFDQANKGTLTGAVFKLCVEQDCTTEVETNLTTDAQGRIVVPVLRPGTYYLVETTPPVGYALDATPQAVTVVAGTTVVPQDVTTDGTNFKAVANTKQSVPQLPLTGGIGQVALISGGLVLLLVGAAIMIAGRLSARKPKH